MSNTDNPRIHRACGGGVSYDGPEPADGRPRFKCDKCLQAWSRGMDGGPWAPLLIVRDYGLKAPRGIESAEDFLIAVATVDLTKDCRRGQLAFNWLYDLRRDLAESIRGTEVDPFHCVKVPLVFEKWLASAWQENP